MLTDLRAAFALLTVLPLAYPEERKPGYAFAYFPLVGLAIGLVLWLVALLPWPTGEVRAFALLLIWVISTGGLHLDGFGDACDGLLATTTPARRLEIMKDPRSGSWAVIGLILLSLGKWVLLGDLPAAWLIAPPVVARWSMVLAAYGFSYARPAGMGGFFREGLGLRQVSGATATTVILLLACAWLIDLRLLALLALPVITVYAVGSWAAQRLGGGLTGDLYGAICELTELLALASLSLIIPFIGP
jgi:adenosylcobinamide-GDP ribazoletransferase